MTSTVSECVESRFDVEAIRPDRLGELRAEGLIDDAQYRAGRKWQACYVGLWSGFWSEDDSRASRTLQFWTELQHMDKVIGPAGASLLRDVLDKGISIDMAADMRGDKHGAKGWQKVLCSCLTKLADGTPH